MYHVLHMYITIIINPRRSCAARVTVVGSVCVIQNLTYGPTNDTTYLTGNEGENIVRFSLKTLRCRARALSV